MSSDMPHLVGIHGFAQSGKDTAAQALIDIGYERRAFADIMRSALYALDPIAVVDSHGRTFRLAEIVDELGWDEAKKIPEVRALLQRFGTEAGRDIHGDDVWVNLVLGALDPNKHYVITDVRFRNEVGGVMRLDPTETVLLKITRPGVVGVNTHVSDAGLDDVYFDFVLSNDGTIADLHTKVLEACDLGHLIDEHTDDHDLGGEG